MAPSAPAPAPRLPPMSGSRTSLRFVLPLFPPAKQSHQLRVTSIASGDTITLSAQTYTKRYKSNHVNAFTANQLLINSGRVRNGTHGAATHAETPTPPALAIPHHSGCRRGTGAPPPTAPTARAKLRPPPRPPPPPPPQRPPPPPPPQRPPQRPQRRRSQPHASQLQHWELQTALLRLWPENLVPKAHPRAGVGGGGHLHQS